MISPPGRRARWPAWPTLCRQKRELVPAPPDSPSDFLHGSAASFVPHPFAPRSPSMAPPKPAATKKFFSIEEANKALPLVRAIVGDIVRQWRTVSELRGRLSVLSQSERKRRP